MARYIDADIAKDVLSAYEDRKGYLIGDFEQIIDEDVPTADVRENVHAHWVKMSDADGIYWACGECGEELPRVEHFDPQFDLFPSLKSICKTKFCPNCGAQMDERREE